MTSYILKSNAKINIGLNVIKKLENSYHDLEMTMLPISLSDTIKIDIVDDRGGISITCSDPSIPTDYRNIMSKIYEAFYLETKLEKKSLKIYLEKNIPHEAGLGGGSSNGAVLLKFLNELHGNVFSNNELKRIAVSIGADIAFFIDNVPCIVKGIGDILEPIENNIDYKILLIKPKIGVSTKEAFIGVTDIENRKYANIENIKIALKNNDIETLKNNIENQLEQNILIKNKDIYEVRSKLDEISKGNFFMTGSGSVYFSFVKEEEEALNLSEKVKKYVKCCEHYICDFLQNNKVGGAIK